MIDQVEPAECWTPAERWMWQRVLAGEIADFTTRDGASAMSRDPRSAPVWDNDRPRRSVRAATIVDILTRKPWSDALPASGFRIAGALLPDGLVLQHQRLTRPLWLEQCRIVGALDLEETQIAGQFSLDGSCITGVTTISAMRAGYISWKRTAFGDDVLAVLARVQLTVFAEDARFDGRLLLRESEIVEGSLTLSHVTAQKGIDLFSTVVKGDAVLSGATITGDLDCRLLRARALYLGQNTEVARSRRTVVAGEIKLDGIVLAGDLALGPITSNSSSTDPKGWAVQGQRMQMGGWLVFRGVSASGPLDFSFSRVGHIDLRNAGGLLGRVEMHGMRVDGEFIMDHTTTWREDARLDLRNVSVGSLQDSFPHDAWPKRVDLQGFNLDRLGGFGALDSSNFMDRPPEWFVEWLKRTWEPGEVGENLWSLLPRPIRWIWPSYDGAPRLLRRWLLPRGRNIGYRPSTYRTFANKLRELGRPTAANRLEHAGREVERHSALFPRSAGLWLQRVFIGYGIGRGYFLSLVWAIGLAGLCMAVGMTDGHVDKPLSWWVLACVDHVLPIVSFEKEYGEILPAKLGFWWSKLVFDVVTLVSWVIGLMLAAGIAGITQRAK